VAWGWDPLVRTPELVKIMVTADILALESGGHVIDRPELPGWA
jgi:GDPmannose 4,6-dehydratase